MPRMVATFTGKDVAANPPIVGRDVFSRVLFGAWRRPTIAVTMPLRWMKSICRRKTEGSSLSKPTMNPPMTSMPALVIRSMASEKISAQLRTTNL